MFLKTMIPRGSGEAIIGETVLHVFRKNISKIFFCKTTCPEKLKFTWKLSDIVQKQFC
jgi:hypothetical protein